MLKQIAMAIFLVLLGLTPCSAQDARRVALVVGIGNYRNAPVLQNPTNDARSVAAMLTRLGFDVVLSTDSTKAALNDAMRQFGRKTTGAGVALFYYAGHGVQVNGKNYLVPADAQLRSERDLGVEIMDVDTMLGQMSGHAKLNLVFLDACRNNPLLETMGGGGRSMAAATGGAAAPAVGLAPQEASIGTLIAYATQPGNVAEDGSGANSPFTTAILQFLGAPNLEVRQMLSRVRQAVAAQTQGRQVPWDLSSLTGDFFFAGQNASQNAGVVPVGTAEAVFWQSIAGSDNAANFQSYLQKFPNGSFSELAQIRLRELEQIANRQGQSSRPVASAELRHVKRAITGRGQEVLLYGHKNWLPGCRPEALPAIEIVSAPQNGRVALRPGNFVVDGSWHPAADTSCVGRNLPGVGIYYTPNPGFSGQDSFVYIVRLGRLRPIDYDVLGTVTVR